MRDKHTPLLFMQTDKFTLSIGSPMLHLAVTILFFL